MDPTGGGAGGCGAEGDVVDAAVVGAGAAGLMTAIVAARTDPSLRIALLDGEPAPGKKILVSGGGRCNVTNRVVRPADYHGDRAFVARVLGRFGADAAVRFFSELGVELKHEPEFDKLFPVTDDARTVLDALLGECARLGCPPRRFRVASVTRTPDGYRLAGPHGEIRAHRVVLATGGRSLPRTGSDGSGFEIARSLGHAVGTTVPALVPLVLDPHPLAGLAGIAFPATIRVRSSGRVVADATGPVLVTHFGISGPAALDVSRHWSVAAAAGTAPDLTLSVFPGRDAPDVEREWVEAARAGGRRTAATLLTHLPHRAAQRLLERAGVGPEVRLAELPRAARTKLLEAATALRLPVRDTRGFNAAEVTAGGVPTGEVDARTMESRKAPGLHLVGEILDVDGRLGGFNFQWAWAGGLVCGQALARPRGAPR